MHIELILLILESLLLAFTIALLIFSLKEGRGRDKLIMEVSRATRVLTRHEYFLMVTDTMMDATSEVVACITGRMPSGEDKKRTQEVIYNIEKLAKNGVKVRYLLPKFQDRLHVGWLYTKAGAEVRYSGCPSVSDFRYTVVDAKKSIVGIPEHIGQMEATSKGYVIPSEGMSGILRDNFHQCWDGASTYEEFLKETMKLTGATTAALAREIKIEEAELNKITGN